VHHRPQQFFLRGFLEILINKKIVILSEAVFLLPSEGSGRAARSDRGFCGHRNRAFGTLPLWGLWAIVWEKDFDEIEDCWETQGRENKHGPFKLRRLRGV
jgi:hypothetical protein